MWGVFSNYLGLESDGIVAMTTLNFTGACSSCPTAPIFAVAWPHSFCMCAVTSCPWRSSTRAKPERQIEGRDCSAQALQPGLSGLIQHGPVSHSKPIPAPRVRWSCLACAELLLQIEGAGDPGWGTGLSPVEGLAYRQSVLTLLKCFESFLSSGLSTETHHTHRGGLEQQFVTDRK